MSMPASSCSLIDSSGGVELGLAQARRRRASTAPTACSVRPARPASAGCRRWSVGNKHHAALLLANCRRLVAPRVDPVVAFADRCAAETPHHEVAHRGIRAAILIDLSVLARGALHLGGARAADRLVKAHRAGQDRPAVATRRRASTAASSIAIAAPCAMNGSIGCAASPSKRDLVAAPVSRHGVSASAHFCHCSGIPRRSRAWRDQRPAGNCAITSSGVLGALQPVSFQVRRRWRRC